MGKRMIVASQPVASVNWIFSIAFNYRRSYVFSTFKIGKNKFVWDKNSNKFYDVSNERNTKEVSESKILDMLNDECASDQSMKLGDEAIHYDREKRSYVDSNGDKVSEDRVIELMKEEIEDIQ